MSDIVEVRLTESQGWPQWREARRLLDAVNSEDPDPELVDKLRKTLAEVPTLWASLGGDVNRHVQERLIERMHASRSGELAMKQGALVSRDALGYGAASQLERLLIDHLVTCWLRLQDVEWRYQGVVCSGESRPISQVDWWERRLNAAQRRYLRVCETLARVRKLTRGTRPLQVNIAARGGQQLNIAGDVEVNRDSEA